MKLPLLLLFILFGAKADDDELLQINKLREQLLKTQKYNKNARPAASHSVPTYVGFVFHIRMFGDLDIKSNLLSSYGTFVMEWTDDHLKWDPASYGGINQMTFGYEELWKPDINVWNAAEGMGLVETVGKQPFKVNSTGLVTWMTKTSFKTFCPVNLQDFPFDQQECEIWIGSWSYDSTKITLGLTKYHAKSVYGPYKYNPEWYLVSTTVHESTLNYTKMNVWPAVGATFVLQRRGDIYWYKLGLPYATASLLGFASFLAPIGSIRRYAFGGFSVALLCILLVYVTLQIGMHSIGTPFAVKCIGLNMFVIGISLIASTLIKELTEKLSHLCPPLPRQLMNILEGFVVSNLLCLSSGKAKVDEEGVESANENPFMAQAESPSREWTILAQFIDRICFVIYIVTTIIYHS